ncbi:hypothetical protein [Pseudomonas sp. LRF_L74]|uniref:hypothetical protein n=1 Tax=Pseudomonas sp. LRF_L74 TaxID=3369422 RepID=UPI003F5FD0F8
MQRDRHTRLESFSARERDPLELDDDTPYPQRQHSTSSTRPRNLTLQIAAGIWLGGTALLITAWALCLVLPHIPVIGTPNIGAMQQETPQKPQPRR